MLRVFKSCSGRFCTKVVNSRLNLHYSLPPLLLSSFVATRNIYVGHDDPIVEMRHHKQASRPDSGGGDADGSGIGLSGRDNGTGHSATTTTLDSEDVGRFSELAGDWWNEFGPLKALHSMNRVRVPWIRDQLTANNKVVPTGSTVHPLEGFRIADVGCGAGILSEPLARLGAQVVGIDASVANMDSAVEHASGDDGLGDRLQYMGGVMVEDVANQVTSGELSKFDAVIASEILEHVNSRDLFVQSCMDMLKPGGSLFVTTLNKTLPSKVLGIWMAESVLQIVPAGIHEWDKFTSPEDLKFLVERYGGSVRMAMGLNYNPLTNDWSWSSYSGINFAVHAVKG